MIIRLNEHTEPNFNEELLLVQLEMQEHGLEMIRKEVYENVGQVLSLVKLYLNDHFPTKKTQLLQTMAQSRELVGKAISDLRQAVHPVGIREIQEKGIIGAIQHELDALARIHPFQLRFTMNGNLIRFDTTKELFAFRIMQEVISACMTIDAGLQLSLHADFQPEEVSLLVTYGINSTANPDQFFPNAHKMQQRAGLIDAVLSFYRKPGGELSVLLSLPLNR